MTNPVEDTHHLVRFVPYSRTIRGEDDETIVGITPQAFAMRPGIDFYLSVSCREFADSDKLKALKKLARWYSSKFSVKKAALTNGLTAEIRQACFHRAKLRPEHSPSSWNFAYTQLWNFPDNDLDIMQKMAVEAWADWVACKNC